MWNLPEHYSAVESCLHHDTGSCAVSDATCASAGRQKAAAWKGPAAAAAAAVAAAVAGGAEIEPVVAETACQNLATLDTEKAVQPFGLSRTRRK